MSMFNDISCNRKDNKEECLANARVVKVFVKKFGIGQWSFIGPGSEKKWYSAKNSPQRVLDNIAEEMVLEFSESGHSIFRAIFGIFSSVKGHGKLSIFFHCRLSNNSNSFSHYHFCQSVQYLRSSGQLNVKNLKTIKMDRVHLRF